MHKIPFTNYSPWIGDVYRHHTKHLFAITQLSILGQTGPKAYIRFHFVVDGKYNNVHHVQLIWNTND
jgi:hypothetical protein